MLKKCDIINYCVSKALAIAEIFFKGVIIMQDVKLRELHRNAASYSDKKVVVNGGLGITAIIITLVLLS